MLTQRTIPIGNYSRKPSILQNIWNTKKSKMNELEQISTYGGVFLESKGLSSGRMAQEERFREHFPTGDYVDYEPEMAKASR